MKRRLPAILTTVRLLLSPGALACALTGTARIVYLPILIVGTLSDIFDGILARSFRVYTPALRRYGSAADVIYYLFLLAVLWMVCKSTLIGSAWAIAVLLISEAACIAVGFIRFGKYPATHTYLAKFYGLALPTGLIALLVVGASGWVIVALMAVALATNSEIILIQLGSVGPPVDVPSIFALVKHAG